MVICPTSQSITQVRLIIFRHTSRLRTRIQSSKDNMSHFFICICSPDSILSVVLYRDYIVSFVRQVTIAYKILQFVSVRVCSCCVCSQQVATVRSVRIRLYLPFNTILLNYSTWLYSLDTL